MQVSAVSEELLPIRLQFIQRRVAGFMVSEELLPVRMQWCDQMYGVKR
jgi:hypothetical protein